MMYLRLLALRHVMRSLLRSLRPPRGRIPAMEPIIDLSVHPASIGDLLDKAEQERRELLDLSKSLDRKLLAVITAGGVHAALLISVRGLIPGPAAGAARRSRRGGDRFGVPGLAPQPVAGHDHPPVG